MTIIDALQSLGFVPQIDFVAEDNGNGPFIRQWRSPRQQPTTQQIAAAMLPASKAARIAQINDECRARILAVWPLEKQISAALGIYGPAELAAMTDWIDAHIAASNTATSAVFDATTQQQMEAVAVTWPV